MKKRMIIAGSRHFSDYELLKQEIQEVLDQSGIKMNELEIVSGGANGADKLGERFANEFKDLGIKLKVLNAEWTSRGYSAGHVRNMEMAIYASGSIESHCVCFWDYKSTGTKSMIQLAEKYGISLTIIKI